MKKLLIFVSGLALGVLLMIGISSVMADAGDRSIEWIFNRSYDSTNTALRIVGQ